MSFHPHRRHLAGATAVAFCLVHLQPTASSQIACPPNKTLSLKGHFQVDTKPEDLMVTPDGRVAIVRGNSDGERVLAFDLISGNNITIGGAFGGQGAHAHNADVVAVTNERAVAIGSVVGAGSFNENKTHVEVFEILATTPPQVNVKWSFTFTDNGQAHDVAITPDGTKAVVASAQRIRVFDLYAPTQASALLTEATVAGAPRWTFTDGVGTPWSDVSADSVEVNDGFAVVQFAYSNNQLCPGSGPLPVVHIVDMNGISPVADLIGNELASNPNLEPVRCNIWPHDLAITPNGDIAVAGGIQYVAHYDINSQFRDYLGTGVTGERAGGLFQTTSQPTAGSPTIVYGSCVDSIAMNDSWLVTGADFGGVDVYDVGGMNLLGSIQENGMHDVAILPGGDKAVVHTRQNTHVITLQYPAPTVVSHADPSNFDPRGSSQAFVSDSVAIRGGTAPRCVSITSSTTASGVMKGSVSIINTSSGALVATRSVDFDSAGDRLVDLVLVGNYAFIRASDSENDLVSINTCTGTKMQSINLSGQCRGVDHLEATNSRVITISQNPPGVPGGFVDIFSY
jgi:hypothetical protein